MADLGETSKLKSGMQTPSAGSGDLEAKRDFQFKPLPGTGSPKHQPKHNSIVPSKSDTALHFDPENKLLKQENKMKMVLEGRHAEEFKTVSRQESKPKPSDESQKGKSCAGCCKKSNKDEVDEDAKEDDFEKMVKLMEGIYDEKEENDKKKENNDDGHPESRLKTMMKLTKTS
jgi:hypothetical protein